MTRAAAPVIFAIAFALLVDEIMLSAIFNVSLGAGNTVAAIAIAMIGLAGGGIAAYSVPALRQPREPRALAAWLSFGFAVSLLASVFVIMAIPLGHGDLIYGRADPSVQLWRLAVYHVTVAPFFLGGLTLAVLFRSEPERIGRLYFADLLGAALGCVASPALLASFGAPVAILVGALPALALGGVAPALRGRRRVLLALPAALLALAVLRPDLLSFRTLNTMGRVEDPSYRSFRIAPGDIDYERWALDAWTIVRSERIPQQWEDFRGWGLSPRYDGPIPRTRLVNYNARFSTYVTDPSGDPEALAAWLDADLSSLHHLLGRRYRSVLNIGAGGGREVLAALGHGAERVVAVDLSDVVMDDIMRRELRSFSGGLYEDPRVEALADEGRNYAERSRDSFDLVEFSIVGGANLEKMDLVRVDDLFTREALDTYLRRLGPDGVFSYVMYSTRTELLPASGETAEAQPYIPALRTLSGLRLALERLDPGLRFEEHVLVAALPRVISPRYDLVHIVASRSAFTPDERARFLETCERLGFVALWPSADAANPYARVARAPDFPALAAELPFSVWPATDDRPFPYALDARQLERAFATGHGLELLTANPLVSLGLGIGALAALLTVVPLLVGGRSGEALRAAQSNSGMLVYFACIGFAYMAIEIAALLKLQSFLGRPLYGLSVGLFAFLLASGLGSNSTGAIPQARLERAATGIVLLLFGLGAAFAAGSGPLFSATIALPLPARIAIAVASIFPMAFVMGMLFPIGVRMLARESAALVPWGWAMNGCFSVLGIFTTRIVALLFGFSRCLMAGLFVYLLVIACVRAGARPSDSAALHST